MLTTNEVLKRLQEGNQRFVDDKLDGKLQNSSRRNNLTSSQEPYAIVLSCADSRVVPELAFDTGLGEIFVIRVAGNIANTSTIASIEYAVVHIGSPILIVMGHESCGAVTAAVAGGDNGKNLNHLLGFISPAISNSNKDASLTDIIKKNAILTIDELIKNSSIINAAVNNASLKIIPAYYKLSSGIVEFL